MKRRIAVLLLVVGGLMAPGAALAVADERAPCMAELTSATATTTQGRSIAALAVSEGQLGTISGIVTAAAQSDDCPPAP